MTPTEIKQKFLKDLIDNKTATDLIDANHEYGDYPEDMLNERIFTWWQFKDEVIQTAKVIVGVKVDFPSTAKNDVYKNYRVSFLILCHKSLMDLDDQQGNRLDLLAEEMEKMWTWERNGVDARLRLVSNMEDTFNDDYYCRTLVFRSITDNNYTDNLVRRNA